MRLTRLVLHAGTLVLACLLFTPDAARAQRLNGPPWPTPVLLVVSPCGGQIDSTVTVTLSGLNLEEPEKLLFSQPGILATRVVPPKPAAKPTKGRATRRPRPRRGQRGQPTTVTYRITIPPGTPLGIHDVRLVNRWGISNPRAFVVSDLPELREKEPNNDVRQAQRVPLNCTVNGTINARTDVDYYVFAGQKGQRVVLSCLASSIDSRLNAALDLYDAAGHWLGENRNYQGDDALLDCTLPHDGDYYVRVFHFAYTEGSPQHFYRLSLSTAPWIDAIYPPVVEPGSVVQATIYGRNLPAGKLDPAAVVEGRVLERLTVTIHVPKLPTAAERLAYSGHIRPVQSALSGFEYRLHNASGASNPYMLVFGTAPVVLDNEANDTPETAQEVPVPCEIAGRIEKRHDRDWYTFHARKGAVYRIEVYGDRLGAQADMYFVVRDARTGRTFGEFDDVNQTLSPNKFYTRDTDPPSYRFVAPATGWYHLLVSSRDADALADVRQVYRVRVSPELPDFQLVAMGPSNTNAETCTLHAGGDQFFDVFTWRQDGCNGAIRLTATDLPPGVTCTPQMLGPGLSHTALVFHADAHAAAWTGIIRIHGTVEVRGHAIEREALPASITWPVRPGVSVPLVSRLDRQLFLAVRDSAPFRLSASIDKATLLQGDKAKITLTLTRLSPEFKGPVQIMPLQQAPGRPMLPTNVIINNNNNRPFTLAAGKHEATLTVAIRPNAQAGTFNLVLDGQAQVPFSRDPKAKSKRNMVVSLPATPITLTIIPRQVARLKLATNVLTVKAGKTADLRINIARLNAYDGALQLTVPLPANLKDVSIDPATIPAGRNQGRLGVHVAANARPGYHSNLLVRATARLNGYTITQDVKLSIKVVK